MLAKDAELAIACITRPFTITVDASIVGVGAVLFQPNEVNKMKVISYNSKIFSPQEQKLSTYDRELAGVIFALRAYEPYMIGTKYPITLFTDHGPILYLFTRKGNLTPRQYTAQMIFTRFPNLRIIHTAGTNLAVADILSRDFSSINSQEVQIKHKTLPPQIEFARMQPDNTIKQTHYLVQHEDVLPTQKNDSHLILADLGDDKFQLRIEDSGNKISYTPIDNISFKSITPFNSKYKKPIKKNEKTLLQQNPILNETDIDDIDDPIQKRIMNTDNCSMLSEQLYHIFHTANYYDNKLTTEIMENIINSTNTSEEQTHAITETPIKATSKDSNLPYYNPSFYKEAQTFKDFFVSPKTPLSIANLQRYQQEDHVLSTVRQWIIEHQRPSKSTPLIKANPFLHIYYKRFNHLYIDKTSDLIHYYVENPRSYDEIDNHHLTPEINKSRICLPFKLFQVAFLKTHAHGHAGEKLSLKTFNQFYYIPQAPYWFSIFIHDCLECQKSKIFTTKQNIAPPLPFHENANYFNYRVSIDTKGPINPSSNGNHYIFVMVDAFSNYVVVVPAPRINAKYAINTLVNHWIVKFGPPLYLVSDRGSEYINQEVLQTLTLFNITHSPRTPYSPWTNGLVENQNRNIGSHIRLFLQDTPNNWSVSASMYAFAHNTTPRSNTQITPYEIVFHTHPRIPLTFELNLERDPDKQ